MIDFRFDIEHWPNYFGKHALKRLAIGYVKGILLLSSISAVLLTIYYFTNLVIFYRFALGFLFVILISPILPIISYLQRNKKVPSYGINKDGFLLNERGWNAAFFTWEEIKEIHDFNDPNFGPELHFDFVSYSKAVKKPGQDKFEQAIIREYKIAKKPLKISNELVKGDTMAFINTFKKYFADYKRKFPISAIEAFSLANDYLNALNLTFQISVKNYHYESFADLANEPCYVFPVTEMPDLSFLVSLHKKSVLGIRTAKNIDTPHLVEKNITNDNVKL